MSERGSGCSVSGKKYEMDVYQIVRRCTLHGTPFNTQSPDALGGCSAKNDLECQFEGGRNVFIEIKKANTPDWMQCSLHYDLETRRWVGSAKNKIPEASKHVFESLVAEANLFRGQIPPFMETPITHEDWLRIKRSTSDFADTYLDCPNDTIMCLYREKGCHYIQISGKGLYHLGEDVCQFGVPPFVCEQRLRVRTKIHTKKDKNGFCKLSVTIACQPKTLKALDNSPYSLDDTAKLPGLLVHIGETEFLVDTMTISEEALDAFMP